MLRSISDTSIGSWKVVHHVTTACGSVLTEPDADAATISAEPCGSGRVKLGPTAHPGKVAASAMTSSRADLDVLVTII